MIDARTLIQIAHRLPNVRESTVFEVRVVNGPPIVGRLTSVDEDPGYIRVGEDSKAPHIVTVAHVVSVTARPA
jgi:hypothetical protein